MKSIVLIAMGLGLMITTVEAQQDQYFRKIEASAAFTVGYANLNSSDFQRFLPDNFMRFSDNYALFGGEGYALLNDLLLGVSGSAIIGEDRNRHNLNTEINGGMGFFHIGYAVINRDDLKVFPRFGFGGGGVEFNIMRDDDVFINDIITSPGREINLRVENLMLDFSIGIDFVPVIMSFGEDNEEGVGIKTGLRVGYTYGVNNDNWTYGGGDIIGAPAFSMDTFYIKLIIGGHGYLLRG